jgi:hypothetical protein
MTRDNLIRKLVDCKLAAQKDKAICVCFARACCFACAGTRRPAPKK